MYHIFKKIYFKFMHMSIDNSNKQLGYLTTNRSVLLPILRDTCNVLLDITSYIIAPYQHQMLIAC